MASSRGRYTALQTSREDEMEAAFESDDEGNDDDASRPMLARSTSPPPSAVAHHARTPTMGGYNFERSYEYDMPPPGSPPRPSAMALPNSIGNTNGIVPTGPVSRPEPNLLQRGLRAVFGHRYARVPTEPVGGGRGNDGVFANVTAKPTAARVETTPDGVHVMPEDSQKDAPPSYAMAQADSVPPYWETTIHAPSQAVQGEMMVDNLPTGTLFSFLWNLLISLSFNFVGFLLTYLLHTTHAAKYGSRAGLGITMLQYGFALRSRDSEGGTADTEGWPWVDIPTAPDPQASGDPTIAAAPPANATAPDPGSMDGAIPYPQEWVAFFLMTVGWFLVLTSFLGYWRVKRWEHQILRTASANAAPAAAVSPSQVEEDRAIRRNLQLLFGLARPAPEAPAQPHRARDLERGADTDDDDDEGQTPEERRLRADLRAAGLI